MKHSEHLQQFTTLQALNDSTVFAFCNYGDDFNIYIGVYKSTDKGDSWTRIFRFQPPLQDSLYDINRCFVLNEQKIYLAYSSRLALEISIDGGKTFERKLFDEYSSKKYKWVTGYAIKMYDENRGVYSTSSHIAITDDGWETYKVVDIPKDKGYGGIIRFLGPNKILMQKLWSLECDLVTFDLIEETWEQYSEHDPSDPIIYMKEANGFHFVNDTLGFACGGEDRDIGDLATNLVYKTTDGGKNWRIVNNDIGPTNGVGLYKNSFNKEGNHGITIGSWGVMMESTDSGETWEYIDATDVVPVSTVVRLVFAGEYPILATLSGGIFRYEDVTDVEEPINNEEIKVVNNLDHLIIESKADYRNLKISIYDLLGRKVLSQSFENQQHILVDISSLVSGPYFYQITTNGKIIKTGKFMK